jgi:hypothetical protein
MDASVIWLMTPLSGASTHDIAPTTAWHARLMVVAWAVLVPCAVLVARFFKVMPGQAWPHQLDNKTWWHGHRWGHALAVLFMVLGLWVVNAPSAEGAMAWGHRVLGWGVCALAALQVLGGVLRGSKGGPSDQHLRGDHYDMSPWRCRFERLHKGLGWLAVLSAVPTIVMGLWLADAPRWMAVVLGAWWLTLAWAFAHWQRRGRCMDTYQAIWGPDPVHPGNRLPPIGWGIRRYSASTWPPQRPSHKPSIF